MAHGEPATLTKQTLQVFVISAAALYAIGSVVVAVGRTMVGQASLTPADLAQFVYPALLSPKPLDRLAFLAVALSVVPVLALVTFWVRKRAAATTLPAFGDQPAAAQDFSKSPPNLRRAQWFVIALVMIFAVYAGGYYRWIGADEVDYKFTDLGSFEAVIYSIMRISQGGTCLVNVMPQYGCYGEFFTPLWSIVTPSVKAVTTVFFLLYLLTIFFVMRFSSRIIRGPGILLLCGIALVGVSSFFTFFDLDLQYWPLRTFFPGLALWLACLWQDGASRYKAFALGLFSAFAISWNLDSGIPVFLSLAILIASSGCTQARSLRALFKPDRLVHLGCYCLGAAATLSLVLGYLSWKAGALADPSVYFHFQRIFYISGLMMLPIPRLPHPWGVVALVILLGLAALCVRALRGRREERYELIAFAAVLALGGFVYYTGRSHIRVLELVSWLPLVLAFCLADRMTADSAGKTARIALDRIGVAGTLVFAAAWLWYYGTGIDDRWAAQLHTSGHAAPVTGDAGFIARDTGPGDKIAVFATNQASLVLTARRSLDLSGPGMIETLLWSEANQTMRNLLDHGPKHLFLEPRIRAGGPYQPVFTAFENDIRAAYVTRDWEPNGRLLHMVRRQTPDDRDQVPYERPVQVSGEQRDFPLLAAKALSGPAFQLNMNIAADPRQKDLAVLASSTETDSEPFRGMIVYHQAGMGTDHWALAMGNGAAWKVTPPFVIPSDHPATLAVNYSAPALQIQVNGKPVFGSADFAILAPTKEPLYIGDWLAHMLRRDNVMDAPVKRKTGSPNYWKIQDRRFNGEIFAASLLP